MPHSLPEKIGNYRVIAQLGQGGMARAMLAIRHGPGGFRKLFVIKQLRPDLFAKPSFVEMFLDEARLAAMLSHPNVVQTHEIGREVSDCFISMEFLEGQSLSRLLRRVNRDQMPLGLHLMVLCDVLAGLHYAHQLRDFDGTPLGVVHRDVSPGNVFVTYDGQVKLLDFGIAKAAGSQFQTEVGVLKGKLAYMAPEQAHASDVDCRSDIFSVGVMLWEALAQRRMVERNEPEPVTLNKRANGLWQPIGEVRPDIAPTLRSVCDRALALTPGDRFQTADEFRHALLGCLADVGGQPSREELAELVRSHFVAEKEQLTAKIAATIEAVENGAEIETDQYLIPRSRRSTTDLPISEIDSPVSPIAGEEMAQTRLRPAPSARPRQLLVGVIVALAIAIAIVVYSQSRDTSPSAAQSGGDGQREGSDDRGVVASKTDGDIDPATRLDAAAPASDPSIDLHIAVQPATATIELDGKTLAANPYIATIDSDSATHRLVVSAPGYEDGERELRFDRDLHVEVVLTREGADPEEMARARERRKRAREREAEAAAAALAKAAAEKEKLAAAAEAEARRKAAAEAKAKANARPKAGDSLERPKNDATRTIDEKNPYQ